MEPPRIQVPDNVLRMTSPGSCRTTFTTKKAEERSRLESEDRKAKHEIRALRRAEAGSRFHKELEKSDGAVKVGDFLPEEACGAGEHLGRKQQQRDGGSWGGTGAAREDEA